MPRPSDRDRREEPLILDLEETDLPDAPSPAEAPPIDDLAEGSGAAQALHAAARGRSAGAGSVLVAALIGLLALGTGVWVHDFAADLIARIPWLGWVATGLAGLAALALLCLLIAELAGLARLSRIDRLRQAAESAAASGAEAPAKAVLADLDRLYRARPEMAAARAETERASETASGTEALTIAERALMAPLDAEAEAAVARAARDVAAATAILPNPALDILLVLAANIRMIRRIAASYGGRAGWLGSWRLMRAVATHLIATGAISATDDLIGPALGGGVLARLSRRFGEAAVNAALTARVGVAAIEVCRPLPFAARPAPRAAGIVLDALRAFRGGRAPEPKA